MYFIDGEINIRLSNKYVARSLSSDKISGDGLETKSFDYMAARRLPEQSVDFVARPGDIART